MLPLLQISDLHRSQGDPVTNTELLATIMHEHDLALAAGMPPVRAIVVCGDLIQGCLLGTANFVHEIRDQYNVAEDLLRRLTEALIGGDKSRLIVVPGNHDVCWNTARSAMIEANTVEYNDAYNLLQLPGTNFRWDWKTRSLFKIANARRYSERLAAFRTFYTNLYGSDMPEAVNGEAWLFPVDNALFVGFESCSITDCFNQSAAIRPETIGQVALSLRHHGSRLRIAVWHHNIEGPPTTSDYLDASYVRKLVYYGFRLGLHGHQHYASTAPVYIQADRDKVMAVISAASLCAGRRELPPGRSRGFNFIVIDEDQHRAKVRSLAMDMESRVQPEYTFNGGSAEREVSWTPSPTDATAFDDTRAAILLAERAKNEGKTEAAVALLMSHFPDLGVYGRSLLLQLLLVQNELDEVLRLFGEELTPEEIPSVIAALLNAKRSADVDVMLQRYHKVLIPDALGFFRERLRLLKSGVINGK